jgi:hypothetical protein
LAGYTLSFHEAQSDIRVVKTTSNGEVEWDHSHGGLMDEEAYAIIQTDDKNFALAGFTSSYGGGKTDMWFLMIDINGTKKWDQTYGGIGYEDASGLLQTADRGFLLAGSTTSYGAGGTDMWVVKVNSYGILEWNQTYGGPAFDGVSALIQTIDGGFALAGYTDSFGAGESDMWVVKIDSNGLLQWNQTFGGTGYERASSILQTTDGDFILVGHTDSFGAGETDVCLVKMSVKNLNRDYLSINLSGLILMSFLLILIWWSIRKNKTS